MDGGALEGFFRICGGALLSAVAVFVLKEISASARLPVKLCGTVLLLGGVLLLLLPLITRLRELAEGYGLSAHIALILKCLGIALTAQLAADLCRDTGEGSLGTLVETAGKAVILLLLLPTVEGLIETVGGLLHG